MDEIVTYFPHLSVRQRELLDQYAEQLLWWNARVNLISRQDTDYVVKRHILHALAIARSFSFTAGDEILDLGTGGGLPGIPLAIYFPECKFTLIDSRGKKVTAVQQTANHLQLQNVNTVHTRAEDMQGKFDFVVTRAVASLSELMDWSLPLLRSSTSKNPSEPVFSQIIPVDEVNKSEAHGLIALKGGDLTEEVSAFEKHMKRKFEIYRMPIQNLFRDAFFAEKYVIFIPV